MTLALLPFPRFRAFSANGTPLAGGLLYSYAATTDTPQALLTSDGSTAAANPVELDANGEADIRLGPNAYKLVLKNSAGSTQWTCDNVSSLAPTVLGDYSATVAQMKLKTDPGELGTESLATSMAGELERLRYAAYDTKRALDAHVTQWYETPFAQVGYHVQSYGALADGTTDDTAAVQAALNAAHTAGGGRVLLPAGTCRTTAPLVIYANTTLQGVGQMLSAIFADHTGDGLQSTATINTNTRKNLLLSDCALYTLQAASTGAGFVDVAGAYLTLQRVLIQGFLHQVIFDGTAHVLVTACEFLSGINAGTGVWLTNGPDHTALADPGFTNVLTFINCQFNLTGTPTTVTHVRDDGGANHTFLGCNFNTGAYGVRACNTSSLVLEGNFFEGQSTHAVELASLTAVGGDFVNANYGALVTANSFSTLNAAAAYHVRLRNALGGAISHNLFVGSATMSAMLILSGNTIADVTIEGNMKSPPASVDIPFVDTTLVRISLQKYRQRLCTSSASSANSGAGRVITPRDMGLSGTLERPKLYERVLIMSGDLTTSEIVGITAITATTLTVTLANSYAADFLIFAAGDTSTLEAVPTGMPGGTGTIASGATSVAITHGLPFTPLAADINITQTAVTTSPPGAVYITAIGATTFTVNVGADPGASGFLFAWRVVPLHFRY